MDDEETKFLRVCTKRRYDRLCGAELVSVPCFTSVEWVCPICDHEKILPIVNNRVDQDAKAKKKLGFEEKKKEPPPDITFTTDGTSSIADIKTTDDEFKLPPGFPFA